MWVTRNKNGFLTLWRIKPKRDGNVWVESRHILCGYMAIEDDEIGLFSDVKWDDEPIEVGLIELNSTNEDHINELAKESELVKKVPVGHDLERKWAINNFKAGYRKAMEYFLIK